MRNVANCRRIVVNARNQNRLKKNLNQCERIKEKNGGKQKLIQFFSRSTFKL